MANKIASLFTYAKLASLFAYAKLASLFAYAKLASLFAYAKTRMDNDIYHGEYKGDFPLDMMNQGFYYGEEEHARMVGSNMDCNAASVILIDGAVTSETLKVKELEVELKELRRRVSRLEEVVQNKF